MFQKQFIDRADFEKIKFTVKLNQCKHCGKIGMLILHGYIYGYDEYRNRQILKGRRIFCSNRNNRCGCGRTVTFYLVDYIKGTLLSSSTAWLFLLLMLSGKSIEKAYTDLDPEYVISLSTFHRFLKKFKLKLDRIRTYLADNYCLENVSEPGPVHETIRHILVYLANLQINPIARFQKQAQIAFI